MRREKAGVKTQVGFNYLKNPMIALARDIVASGEIGEIVSFRGIHAEDYMADAATPWHWRLDPAVGGGVIADLGSHIIAHRALSGRSDRAGVRSSSKPSSSNGRPRRDRARCERSKSTTSRARWCHSARGCSARSRRAGLRTGARCRSSSRWSALRARCISLRSASTSCSFIERARAAAATASAPFSAGPEHAPYGSFCRRARTSARLQRSEDHRDARLSCWPSPVSRWSARIFGKVMKCRRRSMRCCGRRGSGAGWVSKPVTDYTSTQRYRGHRGTRRKADRE